MPLFTRRAFTLSAAAALLSPAVLHADTHAVALNKSGIALDGYDTTAYWTEGAALAGAADHSAEWQAARWQFATAQAAEMFAQDPATYAPQFGGFCTRALSFGKLVNADPEVWRIYQGKLYVFARPVGGEKFDEGADPMIAKASANWLKLG